MKYIKIYEDFNKEYDINNLSYKDLYDIAKWGLENEYSYSGCWDDADNIEVAISRAIEDFKNYLNKEYPIELGNVPTNPIIYRLVQLDDISKLDKNKLGNSWYSNINQTKNDQFFDMLGHLKKDNVYRITGKTNISNIDVRRTLWERSTQWWENEIVIKNDKLVDILLVEKFNRFH